jgi:hypothetical protein
MQTTLHIADEVYRLAKIVAAREGITLTRFIEEALALRLRQTPTLQSPGAPRLARRPISSTGLRSRRGHEGSRVELPDPRRPLAFVLFF